MAASPWCWSPLPRYCWAGQSCWEASCCPSPAVLQGQGLQGQSLSFVLGNKPLCLIPSLLFRALLSQTQAALPHGQLALAELRGCLALLG